MRFKLTTTIISLLMMTGVAVAKTDQQKQKRWLAVGEATLTVLWFDIYHAKLSSESGLFNSEQAYKLTLTYLRNFDAENLIEETFNQMKVELPKDVINSWRQQLTWIWPDVKKGDRITLLVEQNKYSQFYFNDDYVGQITDTTFTKHFSAIWLSDDSQYPELATKLRGEKRSD